MTASRVTAILMFALAFQALCQNFEEIATIGDDGAVSS